MVASLALGLIINIAQVPVKLFWAARVKSIDNKPD